MTDQAIQRAELIREARKFFPTQIVFPEEWTFQECVRWSEQAGMVGPLFPNSFDLLLFARRSINRWELEVIFPPLRTPDTPGKVAPIES